MNINPEIITSIYFHDEEKESLYALYFVPNVNNVIIAQEGVYPHPSWKRLATEPFVTTAAKMHARYGIPYSVPVRKFSPLVLDPNYIELVMIAKKVESDILYFYLDSVSNLTFLSNYEMTAYVNGINTLRLLSIVNTPNGVIDLSYVKFLFHDEIEFMKHLGAHASGDTRG